MSAAVVVAALLYLYAIDCKRKPYQQRLPLYGKVLLGKIFIEPHLPNAIDSKGYRAPILTASIKFIEHQVLAPAVGAFGVVDVGNVGFGTILSI